MEHLTVVQPDLAVGRSMKMTSPSVPGGSFGVHVCVFLEELETSALPYFRSEYPVIFVHATESFKFARIRDQDPGILAAARYSVLSNYTIWEVPITEDRLFDFTKHSDPSIWVERIVSLIAKYKIVYFTNLPANYHYIFEDVCATRISNGGVQPCASGNNTGMPEHR